MNRFHMLFADANLFVCYRTGRTKDFIKKFKNRLKELICRKVSGTILEKIQKSNQVTRGWINYYALGSMKTAMAEIDAYLRTRLRVIIWNFL